MEGLGIQPYMFEPVSDEDADFVGQPVVLRLHIDPSEWRGWFPSSYCRAYTELAVNNSIAGNPPMRSKSVANLMQKDSEDDMMVLPPADYNDSPIRRNSTKSLMQTYSSSYENPVVPQSNGLPKHPILGGGNPFATVKLRPTVTNDRSAPVI